VLQIPTRVPNEDWEHTFPVIRSFINVGLPIGDQHLRPLVSVLQSSFIFSSIARCHVVYRLFIMAVYYFSRRRLPDLVTQELVFVLSQKGPYEFKKLFEVVYDNLRGRNAANGGQEMLRLRAYEKLQYLVLSGAVKKDGKIYTGNSAALAAIAANAPHAATITPNP
jgi:hypothetical protein